MCLEFAFYAVIQVAQEHSQALTARELERRDEITVASNCNDRLHGSGQREAGNIETNPQIHTLLLDIRHEIAGLYRAPFLQEGLERMAAQLPLAGAQFAKPQREVPAQLQGIEKTFLSPVNLGLSEVELLSADRILQYARCRTCVVEVDAQARLAGYTRMGTDGVGNRLDVVRCGKRLRVRAFGQLLDDEAAIEQDGLSWRKVHFFLGRTGPRW